MTFRFFFALTVSLYCLSSHLYSQDLDPDEENNEQEELEHIEELIELFVEEEFLELEENDGVFTEETGPIPNSYQAYITDNEIEAYVDRYIREASYFDELDTHIGDETLHLEEH